MLFLPIFTTLGTNFYQKFTTVNRKNILLFTDLPTSGVNFKNFTAGYLGIPLYTIRVLSLLYTEVSNRLVMKKIK
jgi:hypothetical protein